MPRREANPRGQASRQPCRTHPNRFTFFATRNQLHLHRVHCCRIHLEPSDARVRSKFAFFGMTFPLIMVLDIWTKRWALDALSIRSSELFGGLVPLTLAYNKGAAFGLSLGEDSRWFFVPVTFIALVLLGVLFKEAAKNDYLRIMSITLVVSGAVGNLYDRVRWDMGVVDFLGPVDLGFWLFPIFNIADMAITCGAVLLAISFWFEEQAERQMEAATVDPAEPTTEEATP